MNIEIKNLRFSKPLNQPWEFKVDRTSPIGNPFYMRSEAERDKVCDEYQLYFDKQIMHEIYPIPDYLENYIDYSSFARDLSYDGYHETTKGVIEIR